MAVSNLLGFFGNLKRGGYTICYSISAFIHFSSWIIHSKRNAFFSSVNLTDVKSRQSALVLNGVASGKEAGMQGVICAYPWPT